MNGAVFSLAIYSIPVGYLIPSSSVSGLLSLRFIQQADVFEYHLCFMPSFQVEGGKQLLLLSYLVGGTDPSANSLCLISHSNIITRFMPSSARKEWVELGSRSAPWLCCFGHFNLCNSSMMSLPALSQKATTQWKLTKKMTALLKPFPQHGESQAVCPDGLSSLSSLSQSLKHTCAALCVQKNPVLRKIS